ncbi:hypothetical protein GCM10020254_01520 [Streptomyces goshikiensis]
MAQQETGLTEGLGGLDRVVAPAVDAGEEGVGPRPLTADQENVVVDALVTGQEDFGDGAAVHVLSGHGTRQLRELCGARPRLAGFLG